MSAHTPGPWETQGRFGLEVMGPDFTITRVDGSYSGSADEMLAAAQADARLIAAAPDLLAALIDLVARRDRAVDEGRARPDGGDGRYARARAAISKAGK